jgi:hypothetical protein
MMMMMMMMILYVQKDGLISIVKLLSWWVTFLVLPKMLYVIPSDTRYGATIRAMDATDSFLPVVSDGVGCGIYMQDACFILIGKSCTFCALCNLSLE